MERLQFQHLHSKFVQAGITLVEIGSPALDLGQMVDQVLRGFALTLRATHSCCQERRVREGHECFLIAVGVGLHEKFSFRWLESFQQ